MEEIRTKEFTAKDMFNSATANALKTMIGKTIRVVGLWICERPDLDGVIKTVANFKADDGSIYGTVSDTVVRSAIALPEMLEEAGFVDINVEERPGTKDRKYIVITLP